MQFDGLLSMRIIFDSCVMFFIDEIGSFHDILFISVQPVETCISLFFCFVPLHFIMIFWFFIHFQTLQLVIDMIHLVIIWISLWFSLYMSDIFMFIFFVFSIDDCFLGLLFGLNTDLVWLFWIVINILNLGMNWFWRMFLSNDSVCYLFCFILSWRFAISLRSYWFYCYFFVKVCLKEFESFFEHYSSAFKTTFYC